MKEIKHITELKFLRGRSSGVLYEQIGQEIPNWQRNCYETANRYLIRVGDVKKVGVAPTDE